MAQQVVSDKPTERRRPQAARKPRGFWSTQSGRGAVGHDGRQEGGDGGHRRRPGRVRHRPHARQPQDLSRARRPSTPMRSSSATMGEPLLPYGVLLWTARIILLVERRAPHRRRRRAHPHELGRASAGLRNQAVDCRDLRFPDDALERGDPGPLHRLPSAAPDGRGRSASGPVSSTTSRSTNNVVAGFSVWYVSAVLHPGDGRPCACTWTTASGACSRRWA